MKSTVAVIGSFDTKALELNYLADAIQAEGQGTLTVDCSLREQSAVPVDVTQADILRDVDVEFQRIAASARGAAVELMGDALASYMAAAAGSGQLHAIVGAGGGSAAALFGHVARRMPFGFPKLLVSTVVTGEPRRFVGATDTHLLHPVVDLEGLNSMTRRVLTQAGRAIAALALGQAAEPSAPVIPESAIAATMFGITTPCVSRARTLLNASGREVFVFHATGVGGASFEEFIQQGHASLALDVTTTELADEVVGGVLRAGPDRLTSAGVLGVPQVVSLGALDTVNFRGRDSVPDRFKGRRLLAHNAQVTLMRTDPDEASEIGTLIAKRLNLAKGPTTLVIPRGGVSDLDREHGPFWWPEANEALFASVTEGASPQIRIVESNSHINDPEFAEVLVNECEETQAAAVAGSYLKVTHNEGAIHGHHS